ncbi:MAG: DNA internalization-related competence protein ComEC/Rec2 [Sterolibacterium sp.]|nr:DNA internalization-related competence protein ComEC/Rec2 [Sterolibacterium sp.]
MRLSILCFAFGIGLLQWQPALPSLFALAGLAVTAAGSLLMAALLRHRQSRVWRLVRLSVPVVSFLLGFCWAGGMAQWRLADALAVADEGRDIQLVGLINGLPQTFDHGVRFDFLVESVEGIAVDAAGASRMRVPRQVSLAWYRGWRRAGKMANTPRQELHAGERWRLTVRLKRPHGSINPHGFDYEAWLLENGVRATGYVRPATDNQLLASFVPTAGTLIERVRASIRERFEQRLAGRPYAGILTALVIGDQRAIQNPQWDWFRRTGITHLVSISGLHVTMIASLAYALVGWLWRRQPGWLLRLPAQRAAVLGGFVVALLYCLIAGFQVPAQRTLYMLAVVALALWLQRTAAASRVLPLALLLVLLLDPWAVMKPGFWLSFGAVGVLFYIGSSRLAAGHWLVEWGRAQWAVTLASIPLLLMLFQQFSLISPLANAVAIPAISFVITPLALLAAIPGLGFLLAPAYLFTDWLMRFIHWLAYLPWASWQQHAPQSWTWLWALAGCLWLLLPRGFPARWLGGLALLPLLLLLPQRPPAGAVRVVVLDVGQGAAIHVQTAQHDLLYDTGPRYTAETSAGNRVIVPYLQAMGVKRLDGLLVSHQDSDHSGGMTDLLEALPVGWLMRPSPAPQVSVTNVGMSLPCQAGQQWTWDGVRFTILHPLASLSARPSGKSNDQSCVLLIGNAAGRVLLPSDIEAASERALLERLAGDLQADVLLAPHHGSRTSSTAAFIEAVGAAQVIFSVGYRNRFQHPRADVVARYRATGAQLWRTDQEGALIVELAAPPQSGETAETTASDGRRAPLSVTTERRRQPRYWHGR